ncbi:HEXXH motif-containing putative peptide modification protein [Actinomadura sp. DC4]|uniref:aKG-HExxH-type peptide beta-hydroxylase n=1 Tax=Actinomadura sp. DC4 TaxID=3055069 RepID=UPI0025B1B7BB|nr:HEXXH motif-containing putative peptide modification protein [Actinomadura sp. DC4]MDN3358492.1 HEXXH motif-containing putative peptide modification protein [Actinomadura sp. DC4]
MELHWQPDPARARLERAALSRFLGTQLQELFGWEPLELEQELGGDLVHPVTTSIAYAKKNGVSLSLPRQAMVRAIGESRSRAEKGVTGGSFAVDLLPLDETVMAATLDRHVDMARRMGDVETISFHRPEEIEPDDALREARRLVGDYWPAMLAEMSVTLSCLTFFTAGRAIGFADIYTHGLIALRAIELTAPLAKLAEEIVHESSHVRLNSLLASTPCLLDDGGKVYETPLREDPRPAAGLLHQLFVLARLCEWHDRLGERAIPERVTEAREDLIAAHAAVCAELPLTEAGRALVSTIEPRRVPESS